MPQSRIPPHRREVVPAVARSPVEAFAEVCSNRALSAGAFLLSLKVSMPAPVPGQFVMLGLPGQAAPLLRRPFSVLAYDSSRKLLEIHYSVEGSGTRILSGLEQGQKLNLLGPLGRPFPEVVAGLHVLVAGGRGIAPLIFLARKTDSSSRVLFLAGASTAAELVLLERIKATEIFVATDDGSLGKRGTVIELLRSLDRLIGSVRPGRGAARRSAMRRGSVARAARHVPESGARGSVGGEVRSGVVLYGCGPAGMLRALHSYSDSNRFPCFVSLEARMACGVGVCHGCAVRAAGSRDAGPSRRVLSPGTARHGGRACYALVCKDGPVFDSRLVDWGEYEGGSD